MNVVNLPYVIIGLASDYADFVWHDSVTMETQTIGISDNSVFNEGIRHTDSPEQV